ncbi:hypothetical protein HMI54_010203 [Coelomomyces lativittatus]|nr:hypothetical protein HMI54_010203 [Coelomomyces lativittatus]
MKQKDQFKFIYLMRDPLLRAHSHLRFNEVEKNETTPDHLANVSLYAMQLDLFMKVFHQDQFLLIVLEDFVQHPQETMEKICHFLDIDSSFQFDTSQCFNVGPSSGKSFEETLEMLKPYFPLLREDIHLLETKYNIDTSYWKTTKEVLGVGTSST